MYRMRSTSLDDSICIACTPHLMMTAYISHALHISWWQHIYRMHSTSHDDSIYIACAPHLMMTAYVSHALHISWWQHMYRMRSTSYDDSTNRMRSTYMIAKLLFLIHIWLLYNDCHRNRYGNIRYFRHAKLKPTQLQHACNICVNILRSVTATGILMSFRHHRIYIYTGSIVYVKCTDEIKWTSYFRCGLYYKPRQILKHQLCLKWINHLWLSKQLTKIDATISFPKIILGVL